MEAILMANINVFMVGGRRAGKTTVLASMTKDLNGLTAGTNLSFTTIKGKLTTALSDKCNEITDLFYDIRNKFFIVDDYPTFERNDYNFGLKISGRNGSGFQIRFSDVPGEWFESGLNDEEVEKAIEESQVIIIAIDTPNLMEEKDESGVGRYHNQFNKVDTITNYFKNKFTTEKLKNRLILFVPLKCEKYYHKNVDQYLNHNHDRVMAELAETVKKGYSELFAFFSSDNLRDNCTVAITPILTIGGVDFFKFDNVDGKRISQYMYCMKPSDRKYEPKYCSQPALYTFIYILKLYKRAPKLPFPFNFLQSIFFGGSDGAAMEAEIGKLSKLLNKDKEEGFEIVQNPLGI